MRPYKLQSTFTNLSLNFYNMIPFSRNLFLDDAGVGLLETIDINYSRNNIDEINFNNPNVHDVS